MVKISGFIQAKRSCIIAQMATWDWLPQKSSNYDDHNNY